MTIFK